MVKLAHFEDLYAVYPRFCAIFLLLHKFVIQYFLSNTVGVLSMYIVYSVPENNSFYFINGTLDTKLVLLYLFSWIRLIKILRNQALRWHISRKAFHTNYYSFSIHWTHLLLSFSFDFLAKERQNGILLFYFKESGFGGKW